jgi:shikimate kinase/3-dehydroquinate synthase
VADRPLFLIGFMAAGKTSVGRALAAQTGRRFVDLDDELDVTLVGRDEPEFRRREAAALAQVIAAGGDPIVATGGGAAAYGDNLVKMMRSGAVVALGVEVADARKRAAGGPTRPLLASSDELAKVRAPIYRRAHAVVDTTGRTIEDVARRVAIVERFAKDDDIVVELGERTYPIEISDAAGLAGVVAKRLITITDRNVARYHASPDEVIEIEPGEASKSFATYEHLCNELIRRGADRTTVIRAFGGGVVGDLAGFVAATLFRGIAIVHEPTTLVAMTDSAIGGKTAIDLPAGKNLVGSFHQPLRVICNLLRLTTLPERERRAGFGELWKYALLDGPDLWRAVGDCATGLPPAEVIRACAAYKAAIVSRDERETRGHRILLNLGHTVGHAIESASGLHHGEAVGLGLVAAARVSSALGLAAPELEAELVEALRRTGLPADLAPYLTDDVLGRIQVDKKRSGNLVGFVAIRRVGACETTEIAVTDLQRILRPESMP